MSTVSPLIALATVLNDGAAAVLTPTDTVTLLTAMEANATDMGKAIGVAENAIGESAKAWGCNFLNLVKLHGIDGDTLAERCRTALGWADLRGDAGSKVKTRFNTWRSNIGKVSGAFDTLEEATRNELLGGTRSFITVYKQIIDDEKKAKREADAAKAAAERALADAANAAETLAAAIDATPPAVADATPPSLADTIAALLHHINHCSDDAFIDASSAFDEMVAAYDSRVNKLTDAGVAEAVAA